MRGPRGSVGWGVTDIRAYYVLNTLAHSGKLRAEGKGRWRRYVSP